MANPKAKKQTKQGDAVLVTYKAFTDKLQCNGGGKPVKAEA